MGVGPLFPEAVTSVPEGLTVSPESVVLEGSHAFNSSAAQAAIIINRFIWLCVLAVNFTLDLITNNQNNRSFNAMRDRIVSIPRKWSPA